MKRTIGIPIACALAISALAWSWAPVRAQPPPQVTLTFTLTINGAVPSGDGFDVNWAKNQFTMCQPQTQGRGPILEDPLCAGMGQTFSAGTFWPQGTTPIQFHFTRSRVAVNGTVSQRQEFAQQTVTPLSNRTINASFTYATASTISVPSTGAEPAVAVSCSLTVAGAFVIAMVLRRRRAGSIE